MFIQVYVRYQFHPTGVPYDRFKALNEGKLFFCKRSATDTLASFKINGREYAFDEVLLFPTVEDVVEDFETYKLQMANDRLQLAVKARAEQNPGYTIDNILSDINPNQMELPL